MENRQLRKELKAEFASLASFGVTKNELEALYEMCGYKPSALARIKMAIMRFVHGCVGKTPNGGL